MSSRLRRFLVLTTVLAHRRRQTAAAPRRSLRAKQVRHRRIDTVVESTTLRCMYELRTEHDFTSAPREIAIASPDSLLAALRTLR